MKFEVVYTQEVSDILSGSIVVEANNRDEAAILAAEAYRRGEVEMLFYQCVDAEPPKLDSIEEVEDE